MLDCFEPASHPVVGGHRLGQGDRDVRFRAGQDLSAVEVATVSHDLEAFGFEYGLCLFVHPGKLGTVAADVDELMCDDEMMTRVDNCLHVVISEVQKSDIHKLIRHTYS